MQHKTSADKVSRERWLAAQQWEEQHWIGTQRARARFGKNLLWRLLTPFGVVPQHRGDDWNQWWKEQFDDYSFLPPAVDNALEVGCGPYTNVRLIMERCSPAHLFLSDPLIRTYVRFKLTFVADMYKKAACVLDDHPLEELPFAANYFDLTLMINVLDHVRDAGQCMENLIRVTKPGGFAIIGQDLTNEEDRARARDVPEDVGHPIALDPAWFEQYLDAHFVPVLHKVLSRAEGRNQAGHCGTLIFAGRKKP